MPDVDRIALGLVGMDDLLMIYNSNTNKYEGFDSGMNAAIGARYPGLTSSDLHNIIENYAFSNLGTDFCN